MAQEIKVTLDNKSIEILKKVDMIHRDTILNLGIALIEKTGLYKTLTNEKTSDKLDEIISLDNLPTITKNEEKTKVESRTKSWDDF